MNAQKHLFQLPADIHYLNGAYMSPLLKSAEKAGIEGIAIKRNPSLIKQIDFFDTTLPIRENFGKLINGASSHVAIIPSASYGLKSAVSNIPSNSGDHVIIIGNDFPSGFYCTEEWCKAHQKSLKVIDAPASLSNRGANWNEQLLSAIIPTTCAVVISAVHWADGTIFDLKKIGERCREAGALFIVDGTQAVGALPIDVAECKIDALICSGYKWLLGPYSIGLAYYGSAFDNGKPIEASWMNRDNALDFTKLTQYTDNFMPGAARYNVGQNTNFILVPMLNNGLEQILEWGVAEICNYSRKLSEPLVNYLQENSFWIEEEAYRAAHLFGMLLPAHLDRKKLLQELQEQKITVSFRGDAIRISTHVYNTAEDIDALIATLVKLT